MNSENESLNLSNHGGMLDDIPRIVGFTIFLESGPRQVAGVLRRFETSRCRILAVETQPGNTAGLLKLVVTHHDEGRMILERAGLPLADYHLLAVVLPDGTQPLLRVFLPLAQGNVLVRASHLIPCCSRKRNVILLEAEPLLRAAEILLAHGFDLVRSDALDQDALG